jgi:hypothetical protein
MRGAVGVCLISSLVMYFVFNRKIRNTTVIQFIRILSTLHPTSSTIDTVDTVASHFTLHPDYFREGLRSCPLPRTSR